MDICSLCVGFVWTVLLAAEDLGLLGCDTVWLGECFLMF